MILMRQCGIGGLLGVAYIVAILIVTSDPAICFAAIAFEYRHLGQKMIRKWG